MSNRAPAPKRGKKMTEPSKKKRDRKSPAPKAKAKSKVDASKAKKKHRPRPKVEDDLVPRGKGPIFVRPADGTSIHPALDLVLAKPFIASIYIDPVTNSIRYPMPNGKPAIMGGLHGKMLHRFFQGIELNNVYSGKAWPKRLRSSTEEGKRADAALAEAIRTGQAPPPAHHAGASEYASAVWEYWKQNHHRPVLAQLPVIITHALTATAGDYFTVRTCPFTRKKTLCYWELKTGYPKGKHKNEDDPYAMMIPMPPPPGHDIGQEFVPLTSVNRYYLQALLTAMAFERELGLYVDGTVQVINVYKEREDMPRGATRPTYKCKVQVYGPEHLEPPRWPDRVIKDALYEGIRKQ